MTNSTSTYTFRLIIPIAAFFIIFLVASVASAGPIELYRSGGGLLPGGEFLYPEGGLAGVFAAGTYLAWSGDGEIYLFDGSSIKQITNGGYANLWPHTDGKNIVWYGEGPEKKIFLFDGTETLDVATLNFEGWSFPKVSGNNVAWVENDPFGVNTKVMLYDGNTKRQLNNAFPSQIFGHVDISGNKVVWSATVYLNDVDSEEIFMYDGTSTVRLSNNNFEEGNPHIDGNNVVWEGNGNIYFFDGISTTSFSNSSYYFFGPDLEDNKIAWSGYNINDFESDIFYFDGTSTTQIRNYLVDDYNPVIRGNKIIWAGETFFSNSIFFYSDAKLYRLTNNPFLSYDNDVNPLLVGNSAAWSHFGSTLRGGELMLLDLNEPKAKQAWTSNGLNTWDWNASKPVTGDFNGDGRDDVAVMYDYKSTREAKIFVFLANASGGFDSPIEWWASGPGNWDGSGATLASGDFSGDGRDDIAALYDYASQRDVRAFVFQSDGSLFNVSEWWHAGTNNWDAAGSMVTSGDYTGDGKADLAILYGYAAQRDVKAFVFPSSGNAFTGSVEWWHAGPGNWDWAGSMVTSGDYTGDGKTDLAVLYGYATERDVRAFVFPSSGTKFTASQEWWHAGTGNWDWVGSKPVSGDYDGDGVSDFGVFYGYGDNRSVVFTFNSTESGFGGSDIYYDSGSNNWPWADTKVFSGDFDGDGMDRFGAFFDFGVSYSGLFLFE